MNSLLLLGSTIQTGLSMKDVREEACKVEYARLDRSQGDSEHLDRAAHGSLDVDGLHVVPALLQEGGQEVQGRDDVLSELLVRHVLVTYGSVKVGDLLELPLDGGLHVVDGLIEWVAMGDWLWESTDSVKDWADDAGNFLDEGVSGKEEIVLLGPLLDKLLVLVELLQVVKGGHLDSRAFKTVSESLGLILMLLIGNQADLEVWSWDVWQSDGGGEPLVLLWIVVLESNLQLNGLLELSWVGLVSWDLLALIGLEGRVVSPDLLIAHLGDAVQDECVRDLRHLLLVKV